MIWQSCDGAKQLCHIKGTLFRLVESQEQIATLGYVDTIEEQALLEEMLETTKPNHKEDLSAYHYLLSTPFRYPPLKWGSRFGGRDQPSIFYGGTSAHVTLAEAAYYRFIFWGSMAAAPVKPQLISEHSLFSVNYQSQQGIRLQTAPFDKYQHQISHPNQYSTTQQLGAAMRESAVEVFEYPSARDPQQGNCVGLFTAQAFKQKKPNSNAQWLCETNANEVIFKPLDANSIIRFKLENFLVNSQLPQPA